MLILSLVHYLTSVHNFRMLYVNVSHLYMYTTRCISHEEGEKSDLCPVRHDDTGP